MKVTSWIDLDTYQESWQHLKQRFFNQRTNKFFHFSKLFCTTKQGDNKYVHEHDNNDTTAIIRRDKSLLSDDDIKKSSFLHEKTDSEPVFFNVYGAQESIPRNEFRQPMYSAGGPVR
jgi:hypothetical protein